MPVPKSLPKVVKMLLVTAGCICSGFVVGTSAHYIGLGHDFGWSWHAVLFAAIEGGWPGAALGLLVAVPTYYFVLHGRASATEWAVLIGVTFATATILVSLFSVVTIFVTPFATLTTAVIMRSE